jgi:signal transduction histidine kinase
MKKRHIIIAAILWTIFILSSFAWNYYTVNKNNERVVLNKARAFFNQILVTRSWNSAHGGVYVPVTEKTIPNPYLKDSLRDIITINGMHLTKVNPAYMTRQVAEINKDNDIEFHITSLNPIRPANEADDWEKNALKNFTDKNSEILDLVKHDSVSNYRYMAPLITEKSCLSCHSEQGYVEGEVRGGISVSFPSDIFESIIDQQITSLSFAHVIILLTGLAGMIIYNSMIKKYTSLIEAKNQELTAINATKDRFFSIIAHDLRNPFNVILNYLNLLKMNDDDLDLDQRKEYIEEIDNSAKSTYKLLDNLLLWSRSQLNKIIIKKEELLLYDVASDAIEAYMHNAKLKGVSFSINVPKEMTIFADYSTIKTVIANLFSNAVKFSNQDGEIKVEAIENNNWIEVSIVDNGVGIPKEVLPNLISIDEGYSTKGTDNEKGSGLGLILCKEFVEKNGGSIWVESELGKGTKVTFTVGSQIILSPSKLTHFSR